ncbi:hypothetical protein [Desulfamplus magnetovallimortis]|uniref:hypothetical protein n=1 Tax=Desulfamplus magnetovallimortis TaxID=1246637 RepID=UPI0009BB981D|nr:hypothetical protein [Desulfamplus magnetovallimortis]
MTLKNYLTPAQKACRQIPFVPAFISAISIWEIGIKIKKEKQTELQDFDDELRHHADMKISLDLDDGVKVNGHGRHSATPEYGKLYPFPR